MQKTDTKNGKSKIVLNNKINDMRIDKKPMTSKEMPTGGLITNPGNSRSFKTGDWRTFRPVWDKDKCIHCMICVNYCPENCIPVKDGKRLETDFNFCKGCLICEKECPVKCISHKREGDE